MFFNRYRHGAVVVLDKRNFNTQVEMNKYNYV